MNVGGIGMRSDNSHMYFSSVGTKLAIGTISKDIGLGIQNSKCKPTHLKLRGQNIDPFMGSISFNPYRGQINHDLGHFL